MSWRDAPLYTEAYDLARWVIERTAAWSARSTSGLASRTEVAACDLVSEVALALTFPATRSRHLEAADDAVVRLRILLRLARDTGLQSAGGVRFAAGRLRAIGRMIGGWRKRVAHRHRKGEPTRERELPAARPA